MFGQPEQGMLRRRLRFRVCRLPQRTMRSASPGRGESRANLLRPDAAAAVGRSQATGRSRAALAATSPMALGQASGISESVSSTVGVRPIGVVSSGAEFSNSGLANSSTLPLAASGSMATLRSPLPPPSCGHGHQRQQQHQRQVYDHAPSQLGTCSETVSATVEPSSSSLIASVTLDGPTSLATGNATGARLTAVAALPALAQAAQLCRHRGVVLRGVGGERRRGHGRPVASGDRENMRRAAPVWESCGSGRRAGLRGVGFRGAVAGSAIRYLLVYATAAVLSIEPHGRNRLGQPPRGHARRATSPQNPGVAGVLGLSIARSICRLHCGFSSSIRPWPEGLPWMYNLRFRSRAAR